MELWKWIVLTALLVGLAAWFGRGAYDKHTASSVPAPTPAGK